MQGTKLIDFTKSLPGFQHFDVFDNEAVKYIRAGGGNGIVVIVDHGINLPSQAPYVVHDHINLTGDNPLVGPSYPGGQRFPAINNIYITDLHSLDLPSGTAAGIKTGMSLSAEDLEFVRSLGADFCCYHLVPTMLVAAQVGHKVLGIAIPERAELKPVIKLIDQFIGGNKA